MENHDEVLVSEEHDFLDISTKPPPSFFWTVSVHFVDRNYGGPEEGGWWYNSGGPITELLDDIAPEDCLPRCFLDEHEAQVYASLLQGKLNAGPNKGRKSIYSTLSKGIYEAQVQEGLPHSWPVQPPHYE